MKVQGGGATGGVPNGGVEHSDNLIGFKVLPQANGGVKANITSHMTGNSGLMPGERDLGNMSKNKPA